MDERVNDGLLSEVASYYSERLAQYGQTPQGVDWNGETGLTMRFQQLCKVVNRDGHFSINELGCGYGAVHDYLSPAYPSFAYTGVDISDEMIQAARERYRENASARFHLGSAPDAVADYGVASGIFSFRLGRSDSEWQAYLEATLDVLHEDSSAGFASNCLTSRFFTITASMSSLC
nr:putative class I SAM-dependent methyltransferase [uncultured bacterium]